MIQNNLSRACVVYKLKSNFELILKPWEVNKITKLMIISIHFIQKLGSIFEKTIGVPPIWMVPLMSPDVVNPRTNQRHFLGNVYD